MLSPPSSSRRGHPGFCVRATPDPRLPSHVPSNSPAVTEVPTGKITRGLYKIRAAGPQPLMVCQKPLQMVPVCGAVQEPVGSESVRGGLRSSAQIIQKSHLARRNSKVGLGLRETEQLLAFPEAPSLPRALPGEGVGLTPWHLTGSFQQPRELALSLPTGRMRDSRLVEGEADQERLVRESPSLNWGPAFPTRPPTFPPARCGDTQQSSGSGSGKPRV